MWCICVTILMSVYVSNIHVRNIRVRDIGMSNPVPEVSVLIFALDIIVRRVIMPVIMGIVMGCILMRILVSVRWTVVVVRVVDTVVYMGNVLVRSTGIPSSIIVIGAKVCCVVRGIAVGPVSYTHLRAHET